jgi:outer membrane receptor protein involved in Fe transport
VGGFLGTFEPRTYHTGFPPAPTPRSIERADVSANDFQLRATAEKDLGSTRLEFGLDLNGRYGLEAHDIVIQHDFAGAVVSSTDNLSIDTARRVDTGVFFQATRSLGSKASTTGGLRVDRVSHVIQGGYFGDRSVVNSAAAGFAAIVIGPFNHTTFTAQLARGFRDPTISDRFFRGPSGRGFITGNPDLEPETSLQLDLGARYSTGRLRVATYFYRYRISDLVERYTTQTDFFFFRNAGRATLQGVEVEAHVDLGRGLSVETAAQVGRGRTGGSDRQLDDLSTDTLSFVARKSFGTRTQAFARLAIYATDDRPGPSEVAAPGHTNLDLGASWYVRPRVELRGAIRNVLNERYYASPDPRFVLAPGVNGFLTLAVKF